MREIRIQFTPPLSFLRPAARAAVEEQLGQKPPQRLGDATQSQNSTVRSENFNGPGSW